LVAVVLVLVRDRDRDIAVEGIAVDTAWEVPGPDLGPERGSDFAQQTPDGVVASQVRDA
jgi:hypothetical protein